MIKYVIAAGLLLGAATGRSQTLFTYGRDSVTVPQFLAAYAKNNTGAGSKESLRNYLDLYIASRLKIKEAKERGYDTLPQLTAELANLREQIAPAYLQDEAAVNKLVDEALERSAKDIRLQTIFISFERNGRTDTAAALQRAHEVLKKLETGASFETIARQASDDPAAKENGGDAGFVTVFTVPYAIENLLYNTPAGKTAPLYRSKKGYHIFKNGGERKALGSIKAAQILIAFPPDADAGAKAQAKKRADSLYGKLLQGADFGELAAAFSNDVVSAAANGQMPQFGVGTYDAVFEKAVFGLQKDGAISKPFVTTHGYHIVKRLQRLPVSTGKENEKVVQAIREKVESSDRMAFTQAALVQKIVQQAGIKKQPFSEAALWAYTDSVLDGKPSGTAPAITGTTVLFSLGDRQVSAADWITHAQTFRFKSDGTGLISYPQLWEDFYQATALAYYKDHLEKYNNTFRQQLEEFREGNLFFEIMQREVWNKAQEDTASLETFYKTHAATYVWNKSADAVLFYANDLATAKKLKAQVNKNPQQWRNLVASLGENVAADSARFELSQIPDAKKQPLKKGLVTEPELNTTDNTASFAYILKIYNTPAARTFAEAKGLVVTDYQAALEKAWIAELKKKYPVTINEVALSGLLTPGGW